MDELNLMIAVSVVLMLAAIGAGIVRREEWATGTLIYLLVGIPATLWMVHIIEHLPQDIMSDVLGGLRGR